MLSGVENQKLMDFQSYIVKWKKKKKIPKLEALQMVSEH